MIPSPERKSEEKPEILFHLNIDIKQNPDASCKVTINGVAEHKETGKPHRLQASEDTPDPVSALAYAMGVLMVGMKTIGENIAEQQES